MENSLHMNCGELGRFWGFNWGGEGRFAPIHPIPLGIGCLNWGRTPFRSRELGRELGRQLGRSVGEGK